MYIPKQFVQEDRSQIIEMLKLIQFGALIIFAEDKFLSSHLPFYVCEEQGKLVLEGHVSKTNEIWRYALRNHPALIIFQGPNAYIHPGWYPTKQQSGKVVPTWNYLAVHCHGFAEKQESSHWIAEHLEKLTNRNEHYRDHPWKISDAPTSFIHNLSNSIVGLKIEIDHIEGVWKMNQHLSLENRLGVIKGLSSSNNPQDFQVASIMEQLEK